MAQRRRRRKNRRGGLLTLVALLGLAALGWYAWQHRELLRAPSAVPAANGRKPFAVSAQRVDPANEGRLLSVEGALRAVGSARDAQLGIAVDAPLLERRVEMFQWQETCGAAGCSQSATWSRQPIDASRFRAPRADRQNPPFPFIDRRFPAPELRLGAFRVDPALLDGIAAASPRTVHSAELPPNLAASLRDWNGGFYAGLDPAHPAVGDLRIRYFVLPSGVRRLQGVQRGERLLAPSLMPYPRSP